MVQLAAWEDILTERKHGIELAVEVVRIFLCLQFETQQNINYRYY